jgi:uncharacterized protein YhbP (UPF0306 family)
MSAINQEKNYMDIKKLLLEYLPTRKDMQVATAKGDQPWICTVHYVHDDNLNIYWLSEPNRRHSQELSINNKAAIAVAVKIDNPVVGIQAEGRVVVVSDKDEVVKVMELYVSKYDKGHDFYKNFVAGTNRHWMYKFIPSSVALFDEMNFPENGKQLLNM